MFLKDLAHALADMPFIAACTIPVGRRAPLEMGWPISLAGSSAAAQKTELALTFEACSSTELPGLTLPLHLLCSICIVPEAPDNTKIQVPRLILWGLPRRTRYRCTRGAQSPTGGTRGAQNSTGGMGTSYPSSNRLLEMVAGLVGPLANTCIQHLSSLSTN